MILRRGAEAVALWGVFTAIVAGQQTATFKTRIGLVVLHATVKNQHGELVATLGRDAFTVYENGKRQQIALFSRDDVPVSLALVIDNSGSMRSVRPRVEAAALDFVRASNPQDEVCVVNFADKPRLDVPFTQDLAVLKEGITRVDAIGGTALRDAVEMAESYVRAHASNDRRVLVILSDGNDNASMAPIARIQESATHDGIVMYAVGLSHMTMSSGSQGRKALEELTKPTGGVAYYPVEPDQIDSTVLDLAEQIRRQYTIAYSPINQALDGSYRAIRVEARGTGSLKVITRTGYRATAD